MRSSNYFATTICLMLFLLSFLLFACARPEQTDSNSIATSGAIVASPTATSTTEAASPKQFSYIVKVSDKDTQGPIQGAEARIQIDDELVGPMIADVRGQVVFTFKINQANQGAQLFIKAEGYKEEFFNVALRSDCGPEEVQLSSLTTPKLTDTATAIPAETPTSEPSPSTDTPTPTPTPTLTPTPTPTLTPTPPPTSTPAPATPTGNLAIPVVFNFGTKVYLTGFNGVGINGPHEVSIGGAPGSEDARQPMFSRDGQSVMVKATLDGVSGLFKLTASGFDPQIIIRRGSADWPVLSPDGQTVMFSESTLDYRLHRRLPSIEIETPEEKIEEVSINGRPIFAQNLLWSEDNRLVFQGCAVWKEEDSTCGTWITNASNLDPQRIIVGEAAHPMSIRGATLAYMFREPGKDWDIFIMSIDDGKVVEITKNDFEDGLPAISPDGNMVAYISKESGQWGLWTVNLDGQNKQHWFDIDPTKGVFDTDAWDKDRMSWRR